MNSITNDEQPFILIADDDPLMGVELSADPGIPSVPEATSTGPLTQADRQLLEDLQAEIQAKFDQLQAEKQAQEEAQRQAQQQQIQNLPMNEPAPVEGTTTEETAPSEDATNLIEENSGETDNPVQTETSGETENSGE